MVYGIRYTMKYSNLRNIKSARWIKHILRNYQAHFLLQAVVKYMVQSSSKVLRFGSRKQNSIYFVYLLLWAICWWCSSQKTATSLLNHYITSHNWRCAEHCAKSQDMKKLDILDGLFPSSQPHICPSTYQ